jgi:hypothetical protein
MSSAAKTRLSQGLPFLSTGSAGLMGAGRNSFQPWSQCCAIAGEVDVLARLHRVWRGADEGFDVILDLGVGARDAHGVAESELLAVGDEAQDVRALL